MPKQAARDGRQGAVTTLRMAAVTDPGRMRAGNEDSISTRPELGLAVLADGMGGHLAGEVASGMAVEVITRHLVNVFARNGFGGGASPNDRSPETRAVDDAIQIANAAVHEASQARPECAGMGSTVVVAVFHQDKVSFGHVGDSRLYRFRAGKLEQLTKDHSVIQELVNRGLLTLAEARASIAKNLVTRALGVDPIVAADLAEQTLQEADIYLLCSDGLNDVLADADIEAHLAAHGKDLDGTARRLVDEANARGGPDNISVILVRTGARFVRSRQAAKTLQSALNQA